MKKTWLAMASFAFAVFSVLPAHAQNSAGPLRLLVDVDGTTFIQNISGGPVRSDGYNISSPSGGLNPAGWVSLEDSFLENPVLVAGILGVHGMSPASPTSTNLAELSSGLGVTFPPRIRWEIGHPFISNTLPNNLTFQYSLIDADSGQSRIINGGGIQVNVQVEMGDVTDPDFDPTRPRALLPGDTNNDLVVDLQDFTVLKEVFGTSAFQPDFDQDGVVGLSDFSILKENFGTSLVTVPEPSAIGLAVLALCTLLLPRKRLG